MVANNANYLADFKFHEYEHRCIFQQLIGKTSSKTENSFSSAMVAIGIVVGALTVGIVIVGGVLLMRRRGYQRAATHAVDVQLEPSASPEDRHIAAMQMSGYENPTYKFFEATA